MDYGMVFWPEATVKFFFLQTHSFHFTICSLMDWSHVDYYEGFVSRLNNNSFILTDGTHSLQRIHWKSNVMRNFSKLFVMR